MLPTEPIGSVPRPDELVAGMAAAADGSMRDAELEALFAEAVRDTLVRMEATGSPVVTDGEQRKPSFATYPVHGQPSLRPGGVVIPFADGHTRQLPVISEGPFRYATHADTYLRAALPLATRPVKQAVIAASALSLLYPPTASTAIPATRSSQISSTRRRPTSAGRWRPERTASRSTSPRVVSLSSWIRRVACCAASSS